jgi:hypothetical protein
MQALQLLQQRRRPQARYLLQHRHQLCLPDIGKPIRARAVAPRSRWLGSTEFFATRRAVLSLNPARAAAVA